MHEDVVDEGDLPSNVAGRLELHIEVQAEDACLEAAPQLQSTPVCTSSLSLASANLRMRLVASDLFFLVHILNGRHGRLMDRWTIVLSRTIYTYIHAIKYVVRISFSRA
jgi:hypothetical protein